MIERSYLFISISKDGWQQPIKHKLETPTPSTFYGLFQLFLQIFGFWQVLYSHEISDYTEFIDQTISLFIKKIMCFVLFSCSIFVILGRCIFALSDLYSSDRKIKLRVVWIVSNCRKQWTIGQLIWFSLARWNHCHQSARKSYAFSQAQHLQVIRLKLVILRSPASVTLDTV